MAPMPRREIPDELADRLRRLGGLLPTLERPDFDAGHWAGGEQRADGSITAPYFEYSEDAEAVIEALPVDVFDWMAWMKTRRAQLFVADHRAIGDASLEDLVLLSTAVRRSDRFTEGSIAGAFESGLILAIARRAAVLAGGTSV